MMRISTKPAASWLMLVTALLIAQQWVLTAAQFDDGGPGDTTTDTGDYPGVSTTTDANSDPTSSDDGSYSTTTDYGSYSTEASTTNTWDTTTTDDSSLTTDTTNLWPTITTTDPPETDTAEEEDPTNYNSNSWTTDVASTWTSAVAFPTATPDNNSSGGSNTGKIIGGVIGGLGGALVVGAIAFFFLHRRRIYNQANMEVFEPQGTEFSGEPRTKWELSSQSLAAVPINMSHPFVHPRSSLPPPPPPAHQV